MRRLILPLLLATSTAAVAASPSLTPAEHAATRAMFEHVIDKDQVTLIDFGTGDDRYKADWMDTRAMRMRVELYNPRKPAGLFGAAKAGLRALVGRGRNG